MNDEPTSSRSGSGAIWLLGLGLLAVLATVAVVAYRTMQLAPLPTETSAAAPAATKSPSRSRPKNPAKKEMPPAGPEQVKLQQIERLMQAGNLEQAGRRVRTLLEQFPESPPLLMLAGRVATANGDLAEALKYYDRIPRQERQWRVAALYESATTLMREGDFNEAERRLRDALSIEPNHLTAVEQLGRLLALEGRRWEGSAQLFTLIRAGRAQPHHLILAANLFDPVDEPELLKKARRQHPDQWLPLLGLARLDMKAQQWDAAEAKLKQLLEHRPDVLAVQVAWGELLAQRQRWNELRNWQSQLASHADSHPLTWWIRGRWAEAAGQPQAAIRCYWESMRRYAGDRRPCHRLGQLLLQSGSIDVAKAYLDYAGQLDRLFEVIRSIYEDGAELKHVLAAAAITEQLGRYLESRAWYYVAIQLASDSKQALNGFVRVQQLAVKAAGIVAPERNPASRFSQHELPLPDWSQSVAEPETAHAAPSGAEVISFTQRATALGIRFQPHNGDDPQVPGIRLHQDFGGGVGAVDYDGDGWPDLYLVQANEHPSRLQPEHFDRLYRNVLGNRMVDVTAAARLEQIGYGQSLAVGDYNGDGFPDILIANIGRNRLLRNEGDGTFVDVTDQVGLSSQTWSSAAAMADLDGDGLDELVVVNYLRGKEPLTMECKSGKVVTACRPTMFDAEEDELYWNQVDGTFRLGKLEAQPGRGLGIVAGDFDGDGRVDLFVANDMTANHLYWNGKQVATADAWPDSGLLSGVAFDRDGQSQACMGVAAGDLTGDNRLDLFVTNFFNESNTLYARQSGRLFIDATAEAELRDPSLSMLGFGTQAADFDLDGDLDLIVTNGHIDQAPTITYRMPPQVFANRSDGRFTELPSEKLGPYFDGRYLGRGLLRWDFNRDGKPDVAIAHLDQPPAVLQNMGNPPHHFLSLELRANPNRAATGAEIIVITGDRERHYFVTAGDGYAAVNDRRVVIGLGTHRQVDRLQIRWPGGDTSEFADVEGDRHWIVVQGSDRLFEWPAE